MFRAQGAVSQAVTPPSHVVIPATCPLSTPGPASAARRAAEHLTSTAVQRLRRKSSGLASPTAAAAASSPTPPSGAAQAPRGGAVNRTAARAAATAAATATARAGEQLGPGTQGTSGASQAAAIPTAAGSVGTAGGPQPAMAGPARLAGNALEQERGLVRAAQQPAWGTVPSALAPPRQLAQAPPQQQQQQQEQPVHHQQQSAEQQRQQEGDGPSAFGSPWPPEREAVALGAMPSPPPGIVATPDPQAHNQQQHHQSRSGSGGADGAPAAAALAAAAPLAPPGAAAAAANQADLPFADPNPSASATKRPAEAPAPGSATAGPRTRQRIVWEPPPPQHDVRTSDGLPAQPLEEGPQEEPAGRHLGQGHGPARPGHGRQGDVDQGTATGAGAGPHHAAAPLPFAPSFSFPLDLGLPPFGPAPLFEAIGLVGGLGMPPPLGAPLGAGLTPSGLGLPFGMDPLQAILAGGSGAFPVPHPPLPLQPAPAAHAIHLPTQPPTTVPGTRMHAVPAASTMNVHDRMGNGGQASTAPGRAAAADPPQSAANAAAGAPSEPQPPPVASALQAAPGSSRSAAAPPAPSSVDAERSVEDTLPSEPSSVPALQPGPSSEGPVAGAAAAGAGPVAAPAPPQLVPLPSPHPMWVSPIEADLLAKKELLLIKWRLLQVGLLLRTSKHSADRIAYWSGQQGYDGAAPPRTSLQGTAGLDGYLWAPAALHSAAMRGAVPRAWHP